MSRRSTSGFNDEKPIKPEVDQIGRNHAKMKDNSRLSNQLNRNMVSDFANRNFYEVTNSSEQTQVNFHQFYTCPL